MAPAPQLLGPDGLPIAPRALTAPIAEPQLGGVRNIFSEFIAPGLTLERLANVLRQSAEGYGRDYLTLAEEMEEREHHYGGVLGSRKLAVGGILPTVEPNGCAEPIVKAVSALVGSPDFRGLVLDMLDGLAKGYSVSEILWGTRDGLWWPDQYAWRDPRLFVHDIHTESEVRLAADGLIEGLPLERGRFIVHVPKLKTGIPLRGGLALALAYAASRKRAVAYGYKRAGSRPGDEAADARRAGAGAGVVVKYPPLVQSRDQWRGTERRRQAHDAASTPLILAELIGLLCFSFETGFRLQQGSSPQRLI